MICGAIGMYIATFTNYRTTICCKRSIGDGFNTAFKAGTVMGFCLVSLSLISNLHYMQFSPSSLWFINFSLILAATPQT